MRAMGALALSLTAFSWSAVAQHSGHQLPLDQPTGPGPDHGQHGSPPAAAQMDRHQVHSMEPQAQQSPPVTGPPPEALSGPPHAADRVFGSAAMAPAREELRAGQGDLRSYRVLLDQLEYRTSDGEDGYRWDFEGWYGGDIHKLWIKTEGESTFEERPESAEVQALWSRAISPWFDFQAGARYDARRGDDLSHLVLGVQGLAPYFFEIDAAAFLSHKGDVTARIEAEYDQLITQKLILQPRAEVQMAAQDAEEFGIGAGVSSVEAGLRLRYEFVPEFAPYIGVSYERKLGNTADFARAEGEDTGGLVGLAGIRMWF